MTIILFFVLASDRIAAGVSSNWFIVGGQGNEHWNRHSAEHCVCARERASVRSCVRAEHWTVNGLLLCPLIIVFN